MDVDPDGPIFYAIGASHSYTIEFVGNISECRLLVDGKVLSHGDSIELQALGAEHNRRAVKLKTPFRSPLPPAQGNFLVLAGLNEAKVGDLPLIQYRYLHDDLALVDYVADPAVPDWKDFLVMLTERGVEYLEWRDEQARKRPPATWTAEREELRAALAQTNAAFEQTAPAMREATEKLGALKLRMMVCEGRVSEITAERDAARAEIDRLNEQANEARKIIAREEADVKRLNRELEESMEARATMGLHITEVRARLAELEDHKADLSRIVEHLREQLEQADETIIELTLDRRRLTDIVKTGAATSTPADADMAQIIEHLREQLARADDRYMALSQEKESGGEKTEAPPRVVHYHAKSKRLVALYNLDTLAVGRSVRIAREDLKAMKDAGYDYANSIGRKFSIKVDKERMPDYLCTRIF